MYIIGFIPDVPLYDKLIRKIYQEKTVGFPIFTRNLCIYRIYIYSWCVYCIVYKHCVYLYIYIYLHLCDLCDSIYILHMGVSKNSGIRKWMVYNGKPIKMDDLGVPLFLETPI